MTSHDLPELGLRERKKRATRLALQRAALQLATELGPDVTVEQICARAEVSPRTFHNYFSAKEEALVGPPPAAPSDELLAPFEDGGPTGDLVADLRAVLVPHLSTALPTRRQLDLRHRVLHEHPELMTHMFRGFAEMEQRFALAATRRLDTDPDDPRALLLGAVAAAITRLSVRRWIQTGEAEAATHADTVLDAFDVLR